MSSVGGTNEGVCLHCETQVVAWLESARWQDCFYWKENIPKLPQKKREENRPAVGLYHPEMVILLGTMRSRGGLPG